MECPDEPIGYDHELAEKVEQLYAVADAAAFLIFQRMIDGYNNDSNP